MQYGQVIIVLILTFGCVKPANAQQQIFKNYTVNDGLVANPIRRIFQDRKGFLWIATWEGLSKYDGHSFTNFSTQNGLSHNLVNDFYESKKGLYVALNNGIVNFITADNKVIKTDSSGTVINNFMATPWHTQLVTTDYEGLQQFTEGKLKKPAQIYPTATYVEIKIINDSTFIAAGLDYLRIFNKNFDLLGETKEGLNNFSEVKIYQDFKKRIWVGNNTGLRMLAALPPKNKKIYFDILPGAFNIPSLTNTKINQIFQDADSAMWFATQAGIVKVNPDGSNLLLTVKDGLSSNIVNTIFQDKEKNIWFGTEVGLSKLVTATGMHLYPIADGVASSDNTFLLYAVNKNNFIVSTSKGLQVFNKPLGVFKALKNNNNKIFYNVVPNSNPPLFIGPDNISSLDTLTLNLKSNSLFPDNTASRIVIDKRGNIFSSDLNHLYFGERKAKRIIINDRISALQLDDDGALWVGTWNNGIYRINYLASDTSLQIKSNDHLLPEENIRTIFKSRDGNIWAGTRYKGVYLFTKNKKSVYAVTNFKQTEGLTSNFIKQIKEDEQGDLWLASINSLDKLIKTKTGFRVFNFSRINNYFAKIVGIETEAAYFLWVATSEGLMKIKDVQMEKWPPLPVYITNVTSGDSMISLLINNAQLNYKQNQMQFAFAAPGFINEKQVLYSYRLTGNADGQWSAAGNSHTVSYASLQPASYIFEVRTLGWNGNWGQPAVFKFTIHPPFYKTWWFILTLLFCGLLLFYLFIKWRIKNIKIIAKEKLKVQQLHTAQYKSQLEMEQIVNYFSSSLINKNTVEAVLWDVAKNLIGQLGFVDCIIYLWNADKTKMLQNAGFGPKGSVEEINKKYFEVLPGQGIVGQVILSKEPILIADTSKDKRYRADDLENLSEIAVPVLYNKELLGIIDSEHPEKNFYNTSHIQILNTIATLMANKIKSIEAEQALQQSTIQMYSMNEQLTKAKLEALQSQMNPHFVFNCLNSIDNLIQMDEKEKATVYLSKFAKLIRSILENASSNTVPCWKDMETLKLYLELEALRFDNKFTYEILITEQVLNGDYKVPALLIQPFVENAIHHGLLSKKEEDKQLCVAVSVEGNYLRYLIEDNGVGRQMAAAYKAINKPAYASMGIQITAERINLFNRYKNGSVKITDLKDQVGKARGTKVEVNLLIQS